MKKMTFEVSTKKGVSIESIIKEVNKSSYRIQIDSENGLVTVEKIEDTMVDSIIDLIAQYYTILGVNIDNISNESTSVENPKSNTSINEPKAEKAETGKPKEKPNAVDTQDEKSLIVPKTEPKNEYIEGLINKLMGTVYWAIYKMNIPEKEIGSFILTSADEISMRYNKKGSIKYSVGDIVRCNYGMHLVGEVNGFHMFAIVCNVASNGMPYVVPIIESKENLKELSYLTFNVPEDVVYYNKHYTGGTVLLDKGKYVRAERFYEVVGKATPEFFAKVLKKLSTTFDFTGDTVITKDTEAYNIEPKSKGADNSEKSKPKMSTKKVRTGELAVLNLVSETLQKLDDTKTIEEQVEAFLSGIGMVTTQRMVTQAFVVACNITKINYENVIRELHKMFPEVEENIIKSNLQENFKRWLEMYPELVKRCPKISLMAVLKVFAKRLK